MAWVTPPLVGRARELTVLGDAVATSHAGVGRVVLIEGEAGIGKSRLVTAVGDQASGRGFTVLSAACEDAERTVPFAAVRRLFRIGEDERDADRNAVAALTTSDGGSPPDQTAAPTLQFRAIDALGALTESLATAAPLLLALDDLQWADPASLLALRSIASRIGTAPILVVGAMRVGHAGSDLHRLTDHLLRAGALKLDLGPLDDDAISSLVTAELGSKPDAALLARLQGAAGNPLFVLDYARAVREDPGSDAPRATGGEERLPLAFRQGVLRRLSELPHETQDLLRIAAVLGSGFSPRDLAIVVDRSVMDLAPLLERAVDAGVVEERGDRLAFRHGLVREAVYEHIPTGVRRNLHGEVGRRLADAKADVLLVAQHLGLGAEPGDEETATWLRRAATTAAPRAPSVAVALLERGRDLLPRSSPARAELVRDLVLAYAWAGQLAEAEELAREVLATGIDRATNISLRAGLVRALAWQGRPAEAVQHAGLEVEEAIDGPDAAMLAAETALAALYAFDLPHAAAMSARAEQLAAASGDELALCQALCVRVWLSTFFGQPRAAVEVAQRAIAIADADGDGAAHLAHPYFFPGMPLVVLDRLDEAERLLQEGRRRAEERGLVWSLPLYHSHLGVKKFAAGEWDAAIAELEACLAVASETRLIAPAVAAASAWLAVIQIHRDDLAGADRTLAMAQSRMAEEGIVVGSPLLNWARAQLHEARGEIQEALTQLEGAWAVLIAGANVTDPWSCMALVRLCVLSGDRERASQLLPMAERQAEMAGTAFLRGQSLRCQGLVAGEVDLLLDAVAEYRHCPRPLELASGCEDAGLALADGDRLAEAIPLLEEAIDVYEGLGAARDVARVRSTLRRHGIRRAGRRKHAQATSGWDSLTATELKVVGLVAQRLSNPEVAERLFISRHTVESHLKHVYRKLGVSSRRELAAEASRRLVET